MSTYRTNRQLLLLAVLLLVFAESAFAGPNAGAVVSLDLIPDGGDGNRACPGDFDNNGIVEFADFLSFVAVYGTSSGDANYNALMDMDGNGVIDFRDFLLFAGVFGTTCEQTPPQGGDTISDRNALIALYNATDGPNWKNKTNWLSDRSLGEWYGVTTDANGRVILLYLHSNQLTGSIPDALGSLSNLQELVLNSNQLTGPIPDALGSLSNLEWLYLHSNRLRGSIPDELGSLSSLQSLLLHANDALSGLLPASFTALDSLKQLFLHDTQLCAPTDAAFQAWLEGIENKQGVVNCDDGDGDAEPPPPPPIVDRVTVSPSSPSIEKGETQQFTASAYDSDNEIISGKTFNWSSSNTLVATISASGLATGVSAGSTTITASVDGKSGTATLTVTEPPPPPPVVDRVTVSPSSPSIEKGETQQFTASAYDSDNEIISGKTFNWSSSNTLVATISASGLATGVSAGSTTITASVDGKSGTTTLTVTEPPPPPPIVDRVTVSPSSPSIEKDETQQFTASAYDSDNEIISGKTFNWSSSNTLVATISASGLATGVSAGSTTITASVDGKSGTATLTVTEPPPPPPVVDRVTVSPSSPSIEKGETQQFTASAYDSDNGIISGKTFNWSSSNTLVATISASGLATGVSAGSTTITASVDGKSGTTTLTVTEPPPPPPVVDRVTVSPSSPSIEKDETQQFTASAYDSDNEIISGKTFNWSSSNTLVATISASGLARGVSAGSTTIKASVDGKSGTATLTVTEPPPPPPIVDRVTVSPSSPSIEKGETQQFTASAYDSDNEIISGKTFNWSSSNTLVATISASGLATGVSAGSTTITASVDGKSGTATLTVTEPPPPPPVVDRVTVSPSSPSIEKGETQQFTASAYDSDNEIISGKTFDWSSSNTLVATISASGLARGVSAGSTTITASVDGKSGTATLTVTEPPPPPPVVDRVTVSPSSPSIEKGETQQFTASAYDSDNEIISGKTFDWSSSNTLVATISASGLATGVGAGSTTIKASVDGKSGTTTLTVTEPPPPPPVVDRVTVSPSSPSIEKDETQQFTASAYDSDNEIISGKTFNWSSSNTLVATISASGLATGVSAGSTTITASVDGKSGTTTLTVTEPPPPPPVVDRVTVSPSSPSIEKDGTQQFTASAYDSDNEIISGKTFNWSSSNISVATISASGLATGVGAGSTTITASVDGKSGTATLTVTEPPPPTLTSRTATISGTSQYPSTAGSVTFEEVAGGRLKLTVTGMNDGGGVAAHLFLHTSSSISWRVGNNVPDGARHFGDVTNDGSFSETFTPDANETIDSYDHVILHCALVNMKLGSGSLSN